jgi:hypothetical protein
MAFLSQPLTQPQERENRHDHNDQADEIDQSIHVSLRLFFSKLEPKTANKKKRS